MRPRISRRKVIAMIITVAVRAGIVWYQPGRVHLRRRRWRTAIAERGLEIRVVVMQGVRDRVARRISEFQHLIHVRSQQRDRCRVLGRGGVFLGESALVDGGGGKADRTGLGLEAGYGLE